MKETRYYNVAGHVLKVTAPAEDFALMTNYEPFAVDAVEAVVRLTVTDGEPVAFAEELRQEEEGQEIVCGKTAAGEPVFQFCHGPLTLTDLFMDCRQLFVRRAFISLINISCDVPGSIAFILSQLICLNVFFPLLQGT